LLPSSTQNFTVSKVVVSQGGSYAAICGSQGLSVIELPTRWGSDGLYHDGKSQITCKAVNIHEYTENQLEVVQIRWHPNSPSDSHLLVLYSDNTIKFYDECNLKYTWRVGPAPPSNSSGRKYSFLKSLGDIAIDFDIAPAQLRHAYSPNCSSFLANSSLSASKSHLIRDEQKKIEWPIVILRGNGNIFVICAGLNTDKPKLQGSFCIFYI
jgi:nuclear pore complex protein Nup88